MKKLRLFTFCIVLLSALFITACNWDYTGNNRFEYRLQGTWESYSINSTYYGSLKITSDKITIEGYDQYDYYFDDPRRPFSAFPKGFPLDGYSEKTDNNRGIIYIENGDGFDEIPYRYDSSLHDGIERLLFTFSLPGTEVPIYETLIKLAD